MHSVPFGAELKEEGLSSTSALNAYWEPIEFETAATGESQGVYWRRWIDTFLDMPQDVVPWQRPPRFLTARIERGPAPWSSFGQVLTMERFEDANLTRKG